MGTIVRLSIRARAVLSVLVATAALVGTPTAATAAGPGANGCGSWDEVYAVGRTGSLTALDYCLSSGAPVAQPPRQLAPAGWRTGEAMFSGRTITHGSSAQAVIYQVSRGGSLYWYTDGVHGGTLGAGKRVGAQFGDWRRYRSLFSPGFGVIYGIDGAGRVLRWVHLGVEDGSDTWTGPETFLSRSPGRRLVGAATAFNEPSVDFVVGFGSDPGTLRSWHLDGTPQGSSVIRGATGSGPVTFVRGQRGYARAATGRVLRIDPTRDGWTATELPTASYSEVFAGDFWQEWISRPYEWQ
jgi:hypothetical protein